MELFERNGFQETTVAEIAAAVDMSPRTFFRYFKSKEDVAFAQSQEALARALGYLDARPSEETDVQALREALMKYSESLQERRDMVVRQLRVVRHDTSLQGRQMAELETWRWALAGGLAGRATRENPNTRDMVVVLIILGAFTVAFYEWVGTDATSSLPDALGRAYEELEAVCRDM